MLALRIVLRGRVQGTGRAAGQSLRLAQELELVGSVGNSTGGVVIHVEGPAAARRIVSSSGCRPVCPRALGSNRMTTSAAAPLGDDRLSGLSRALPTALWPRKCRPTSPFARSAWPM